MKSFQIILDKMEASQASVVASEEATTFGEKDVNALKSQVELEALTIENKLRAEELEGKKQDRCQRKIYAWIALSVLVVYMVCVFLILFFNGFNTGYFSLDNSVLIALITTTTANVIGIFAFVMMYLFNTKQNRHGSK